MMKRYANFGPCVSALAVSRVLMLPLVLACVLPLVLALPCQAQPSIKPRTGAAEQLATRSVTVPFGTQGVVVRVTDGDSLWLKPAEGAAIEVRLNEIDAPESCQAGGPEARVALRRIAMGKTATLEPVARDRYGRTVARVRVGGLDLGPYMVMQGHAWSQRGPWGNGPLVKEEQAAQAAKRGLHAGAAPMLPSEFRRRHGSCYARGAGARASNPASGLR
jgi:micrococcal nuclease